MMVLPMRRMVSATKLLLVAALVALVTAASCRVAFAAQYEVADDPFAHGAKVELADGTYDIAVELVGGSGKATIASPAQLEVRDGVAVVTVQWSSPNYDYMVVDGLQYLPVNTSGNSAFAIPVLALDEAFTVVGDTTAMSTPHEIEYQIVLDSSSVSGGAQTPAQVDAARAGDAGGIPTVAVVGIVAAVAVAVVIVLVLKGRRNHA